MRKGFAALREKFKEPVLLSLSARHGSSIAPGSATQDPQPDPGSVVVAHALRRTFSNADKRRILAAADRCSKPGEIGALMRSEGVYPSSLSTWRRQRETADLAALAPQERGPELDPHRAGSPHIAQRTRECDRLKSQLDKAVLVSGIGTELGGQSLSASTGRSPAAFCEASREC